MFEDREMALGIFSNYYNADPSEFSFVQLVTWLNNIERIEAQRTGKKAKGDFVAAAMKRANDAIAAKRRMNRLGLKMDKGK